MCFAAEKAKRARRARQSVRVNSSHDREIAAHRWHPRYRLVRVQIEQLLFDPWVARTQQADIVDAFRSISKRSSPSPGGVVREATPGSAASSTTATICASSSGVSRGPARKRHRSSWWPGGANSDWVEPERQAPSDLLLAFLGQRVVLSRLHVAQKLLEPHPREVRGSTDGLHGLVHRFDR